MAISRSLGETSLTIRSPITISPLVASSRPAIMRRAVVLPQPEGPTSTINSLSRISRLMLLTAVTLLNDFVRFLRTTPAMNHKSPARHRALRVFPEFEKRVPDDLSHYK